MKRLLQDWIFVTLPCANAADHINNNITRIRDGFFIRAFKWNWKSVINLIPAILIAKFLKLHFLLPVVFLRTAT